MPFVPCAFWEQNEDADYTGDLTENRPMNIWTFITSVLLAILWAMPVSH